MLVSALRRPWVVGLALVAVATIAGLVWFLGGSEPAPVDLRSVAAEDDDPADDALDEATDPEVDDSEAAPADDRTEEVPGGADDPSNGGGVARDGLWVVDTEVVAFDGEAGEGTFVGYRVDEELSGIGATTAVGRTPVVDGVITVEAGEVSSAEVVADLRALVSDDSRRDGRVRSLWPADATATFVLTGPIAADIDPDGEVTEATATGELTIGSVTTPVDVALQVASRDVGVVVAGSTTVLLSDLDIEPPSAPIVLSVADEAVIEWQLHLVPSGGG